MEKLNVILTDPTLNKSTKSSLVVKSEVFHLLSFYKVLPSASGCNIDFNTGMCILLNKSESD